jgi:hypothetical protein
MEHQNPFEAPGPSSFTGVKRPQFEHTESQEAKRRCTKANELFFGSVSYGMGNEVYSWEGENIPTYPKSGGAAPQNDYFLETNSNNVFQAANFGALGLATTDGSGNFPLGSVPAQPFGQERQSDQLIDMSGNGIGISMGMENPGLYQPIPPDNTTYPGLELNQTLRTTHDSNLLDSWEHSEPTYLPFQEEFVHNTPFSIDQTPDLSSTSVYQDSGLATPAGPEPKDREVKDEAVDTPEYSSIPSREGSESGSETSEIESVEVDVCFGVVSIARSLSRMDETLTFIDPSTYVFNLDWQQGIKDNPRIIESISRHHEGILPRL